MHPGEFFVGDQRHRVRTVLGSCVSITLWHRKLRVGAMSHFVLPAPPAQHGNTLDARYGSHALALMLGELARLGVRGDQCEAKVFGGAAMFAVAPGTSQVGTRNGDSARNMLDGLGIPITSEHLYGAGHRQIVFDIASGDVWARQLPATPSTTEKSLA
nr:chemotaxis protein CheD [Massilia sp. TS11]